MQGKWRALIAKRQIRKSIHALYEKVWSAEHQRFFYYNVKNYKSQLEESNYILNNLTNPEYLNNIEPYHGLLAWNLANAYFHNNNIEEGWRVFNKSNEVIGINYPEIPRWNGESLSEKTIVLTQYNASGGGDDIMFAQMIKDVIGAVDSCYVEADSRSAPLYLRSFEGANIFLQGDLKPFLN